MRMIVLDGRSSWPSSLAGSFRADRPPARTDEVVSVAERVFAAAGLGRSGLDLLAEGRTRSISWPRPGEMAALVARRSRVRHRIGRRARETASDGLEPRTGASTAPSTALSSWTTELRIARDGTIPGLAEVRGARARRSRAAPDPGPEDQRQRGPSNEGEPAVLFLGGHHAREWISVEVPLLLGRSLLEDYGLDPRSEALVDAGEIWIVPIVNPDGLEYSIHVYRLLAQEPAGQRRTGPIGVDLNRNYGQAWGIRQRWVERPSGLRRLPRDGDRSRSRRRPPCGRSRELPGFPRPWSRSTAIGRRSCTLGAIRRSPPPDEAALGAAGRGDGRT
ncbi:MAG: hypothetical protein M0C28_39180 [Candidatus Moduliflexus flocculans]|nr:hypothetical protein [Candidatus Moduliflexus flocculans]